MKKRGVLLVALILLLPTLPVRAGDEGHSWTVLVVDTDPNGTNVRASPSGQVLKVLPFRGKDSLRLVKIIGQSGRWFNVQVDGIVGWMHGSVLGSCASATEDGDPGLSTDTDDTPSGIRVPAGAPVALLGMHTTWLHVRYVDAKGKSHDGWLPEQAVAMSEHGLEQCAKAWAGK